MMIRVRGGGKKKKKKKKQNRHVNRNTRKPNHSQGVTPLRSLRPVTERQDETHEKKAKIKVVDNDVEDVDALEVERRVFHRIREDVESDVIVGLRGGFVSSS